MVVMSWSFFFFFSFFFGGKGVVDKKSDIYHDCVREISSRPWILSLQRLNGMARGFVPTRPSR